MLNDHEIYTGNGIPESLCGAHAYVMSFSPYEDQNFERILLRKYRVVRITTQRNFSGAVLRGTDDQLVLKRL